MPRVVAYDCRARSNYGLEQTAAATVLLEACGSSHFWARRFRSFGHTVVLLPPAGVRGRLKALIS
jgi:transposase